MCMVVPAAAHPAVPSFNLNLRQAAPFPPSKIVLASQVLHMHNGLCMTWEVRNAAQANLPTPEA